MNAINYMSNGKGMFVSVRSFGAWGVVFDYSRDPRVVLGDVRIKALKTALVP